MGFCFVSVARELSLSALLGLVLAGDLVNQFLIDK